MTNVGRLYVDGVKGGGSVYALLRTGLGYIALELSTGNTFGGLQRTIQEATNGLVPTGYRIDVDKSCVEGRMFQGDD